MKAQNIAKRTAKNRLEVFNRKSGRDVLFKIKRAPKIEFLYIPKQMKVCAAILDTQSDRKPYYNI